MDIILVFSLLVPVIAQNVAPDFSSQFRQCEPIRIEMCRGIGYNETSMPNLVGHELQTDVEFTLQTFAPLIEYVCSSQLKLFLCAAYVPMCTLKVAVPIGPCRSLCESVRSRCHPVLQGFGFPWPPALDCNRFPKENNHESMCMEGPGEVHSPVQDNDLYPGLSAVKTPTQGPVLECPGLSKSQLYVKLHRSGRCAPLCDADILFGQHEKHLAEVWTEVWTYAALGLAVVATICLILSDEVSKNNSTKWSRILTPLVWCHDMVAIGWTVRFVSGRTATACGYDPQLPNVSLLLVDGLSNAACASTFLLRYYFGMAACAWWAILCLDWHRGVRRNSLDTNGHIALNSVATTYPTSSNETNKRKNKNATKKNDYSMTHSNLACFIGWGLPAFQTAAVIVARLVDADELLGACFVGNQSDKGLQIFVATPLFCYWIFGSMNLISGYLVHRRNKELLQNTTSVSLQHHLHASGTKNNNNSGFGTFLFIYCAPCALLLLVVIYEFANIDVWLNVPIYLIANEGNTTPLWPFLTRAFMELMLGIICSAWVLGPKISTMYKRQLTVRPVKQCPSVVSAMSPSQNAHTGRASSNVAYSTVSYQTVRQVPSHSQHHSSSATALSLNQMSNYSLSRSKGTTRASPSSSHLYVNQHKHKHKQKQQSQLHRYGNETIL